MYVGGGDSSMARELSLVTQVLSLVQWSVGWFIFDKLLRTGFIANLVEEVKTLKYCCWL